jgi:hypothetical protein
MTRDGSADQAAFAREEGADTSAAGAAARASSPSWDSAAMLERAHNPEYFCAPVPGEMYVPSVF